MDYDGVSGVQCVDLIKYYLDEVFGIKPGAWGDARNYYESFTSYSALTNNFTRISGNNASFVPKKGDIVVWGGQRKFQSQLWTYRNWYRRRNP